MKNNAWVTDYDKRDIVHERNIPWSTLCCRFSKYAVPFGIVSKKEFTEEKKTDIRTSPSELEDSVSTPAGGMWMFHMCPLAPIRSSTFPGSIHIVNSTGKACACSHHRSKCMFKSIIQLPQWHHRLEEITTEQTCPISMVCVGGTYTLLPLSSLYYRTLAASIAKLILQRSLAIHSHTAIKIGVNRGVVCGWWTLLKVHIKQ